MAAVEAAVEAATASWPQDRGMYCSGWLVPTFSSECTTILEGKWSYLIKLEIGLWYSVKIPLLEVLPDVHKVRKN